MRALLFSLIISLMGIGVGVSAWAQNDTSEAARRAPTKQERIVDQSAGENAAKAQGERPTDATGEALPEAVSETDEGVTDAALAADENNGLARPWQLHFQDPASPVMERLDELHDAFNYVISLIVILVVALLAYVCIRFNAKRNPVPSRTTHHTLLEIVWTALPILILIGIAIPSLRLHYFMTDTEEADMTLKVVGNQWYWHYAYPDHGGFEFDANIKKDDKLAPGEPRLLATDNKVVVPVDTTVRVQMTAADVIHSWAMPALGVKTDAVPGRLNETWFRATRTGVFYGQCSELCGVNHAFMPIELHVVSKDAFKAWAARAEKEFAGSGNVDTAAILREVTATAETDAAKADAAEADTAKTGGVAAQQQEKDGE